MSKIINIGILLLFPLALAAQGKFTLLNLGDYAFEQGNFYVAAEQYQKALEKDNTEAYAAWKTAESYRHVREYQLAKEWYQKAMQMKASKFPLAQYYYAEMLLLEGNYREAKAMFENFYKSYKGEDLIRYKRLAKNGIESSEFALEAKKQPVEADIANLGANINNPNSDLAPILYDQKLIFASLRSDTFPKYENRSKNPPVVKLYSSEKENKNWQQPQPYIFNDNNFHTGNGAFSPDKKRFYFTRCQANDKGKMICNIYVSKQENGHWKAPGILPLHINLKDYTATHPAVGKSPKEGEEILYFTSDRPGGKGGMDLWYSVIKKDSYSPPQNLGRNINTEGDEQTPYFDDVKRTIYFSSTGHPGFGGMDIFSAKGAGRSWTAPQNVGYPVNSSVDDFYYSLAGENDAFFVSNRSGGIPSPGKGKNCCDDIYQAKWKKQPHQIYLSATAFSAEFPDEALEEAYAFLFVIDSLSPDKEVLLQSKKLSPTYTFFPIDPKLKYKVIFRKKGYFNDHEIIMPAFMAEQDTLHVKGYLKKYEPAQAYKVINASINFEFGEAALTPKGEKELDNLVWILQHSPDLIVEIGAHTDSIGTDEYNLALSQGRAESVVQYLIENGIDPERLKAQGYGESKPVAPNALPDGSDNPAGREKNRRVEYKILGETSGTYYFKPVEP